LFKRVVKTVFNQRRKMLRVSLKQMLGGRDDLSDFFAHEMMTRRPEQLSIQEFVELTNMIAPLL
jgi:16S rRNA (adenine1518-N6/adenine1519-N6)-dimethyltransferase